MKIENCPFCDSAQSYRYILQTENLRVIYPKAPACSYHVLIVPKRHIKHIDSLDKSEAVELFAIIEQLASVARAKIQDFIGFNILSNNGSVAVRQHVQHAHMHMFLRTKQEVSDPLRPGDSDRPPELTDNQLVNMHFLQSLFEGKV